MEGNMGRVNYTRVKISKPCPKELGQDHGRAFGLGLGQGTTLTKNLDL